MIASLRVTLIIALLPVPLLSQTTPSQVWKVMGESHQRAYVRGVVDGVYLAQSQVAVFLADSSASAWLKRPPDARVPLDSAVALLLSRYIHSNINAVVDGISVVYSDPTNSCLALPMAVIIAVERLNGASMARVENLLTGSRRVSANSCKP